MTTGTTTTTSLWRHTEFLKFWSGETVSQIGAQLTQLALPLTAVYVLHATPSQLGVLNAASYAPFLGLTLFIGVWADRVRRRPLMISSNVGRFLLVGSIPAASAFGVLRLGYVYVAALLIGVLTVVFDVSYQSYLPTLIGSDQLVEGNGKLQATSSVAQIGGPGLAGLLVQVISAPMTLLVNAASYLVSVGTLTSIRTVEPPPPPAPDRRLWREIGAGLKLVFGNPILRACALQSGVYNLFWMSLQTLFVLYAARQLDLKPGFIGTVMSVGAVGALLGSMLAAPFKRLVGLGPAIVVEVALCCVAPVLIPLAAGSRLAVLAMLVGTFALAGAGATMANVHIISLRQVITPDQLLGRMNASYRFLSWGCLPLGALLGGLLGDAIGLRPGLWATAAGFLVAVVLIVASPVRTLRELPDKAEDEPVGAAAGG